MASHIQTKKCSSCKKEKPLSAFSKSKQYRDGHRGQCTQCRVRQNQKYRTPEYRARQREYYHKNKKTLFPNGFREHHLLRKYGISQEDYRSLLESQNFRCGICQTDDPGNKYGVFAVDHCHETGRVRGLLCPSCNIGIGKLGDSEDGIIRALNYLRS